MDYRFTAVAAAPDSTTIVSRNSDPVNIIAYRPISEDGSSGNTPLGPATTITNTGYVNGAQPSINYRPRQPEPIEARQEEEIPADLDVDFDNKCSEEYAKLDEIRATYDVARGECSTSPEHLQSASAMNPIYRGVPNYSKKQKKKARRSCMLHCIISILLVGILFSLALGAFVLANTFNIGMFTGSAPVSNEDLANKVEQLKEQVDGILSDFSAYRDMHSEMINAINLQIEQVQRNCPSEDDTTTSSPDGATPLPTLQSATTPTSPRLASISIYENCTLSRRGVCQVSRSALIGDSGSPRFASCATATISLSDQSEGYISNVFCSVSAEQVLPITSSLIYSGGSLSCYCHALEITNFAQSQLRDFDCEMFVTHCPARVQLPAN